jgi:hypothetical protein
MPYTIPEWFRPGPDFLVAPTYSFPKAVAVKEVCFDAQNIIYMSLAFHFGIILCSILALMMNDRIHDTGKRSKTNALRYAPPLSD